MDTAIKSGRRYRMLMLQEVGGRAVRFALLLLIAAGSITVRTYAAAPSAEVFGALPAETDVVLSPDGHWLAWMDHKDVKPRVVMFDVVARKPQRILALPERTKLRALWWNDSETLLITLSETAAAPVATQLSREYFLTTAYDVGGGEGRMLPMSNGRTQGAQASVEAQLIRARTTKPHTVIMSSRIACHGGTACLLEVDTTTGQPTLLKVGNEHTTGWIVDRAGKPVAREDWDWTKRAYRVYALSGNGIKEILRTDDADQPILAGLLPDDSALLLLSSNGRPHQAAFALPLDGSPQKLLAEDPDADVTGSYTDPYTGAIIGVYVAGTKTNVHWLDPAAQHRHELMQRAFPNREVSVYGWSSDGSKTLARVETPSAPPIYYLVDFTTHHADIAAEEYPALAGVALGEFKAITYKSRDGTEIPAYLTTPSGKTSTAGPLVILPHGGPNARDYPQFDWVVQFLVSRGYTVLQPQFRGSTGFGKAFLEAGYRQWGGLMQDDVSDGARAMIEQGVADPHRICVVGMSYGGYVALAGAAFTPKLYACAVSVNGISDLRSLLEEEVPMYSNRGRWISASQSQWKERIGSPSDSALSTKSPINSIASITTPIMIVYGTGDGIVPNEQSERMANALSAAGKPVTVVKLADEDHWLSRTDTRVQMLKAFESFLSDHL
jgi:dipeptidyl aminopeptidase/acylaminoacyl peptidase